MISTSYIIEKKSVLPHWDEEGRHKTLQDAKAALPYHRKDTRKPLRIVRVDREILVVDDPINQPTAN